MADLGSEFASRAATFRRLAGELKSDSDRAALIAIAEEYEGEAERLRTKGGTAARPLRQPGS